MKRQITLFLFLAGSIIYCQNDTEIKNTRLDVAGNLGPYNSGLWVKTSTDKKITGSVYLLENWNTVATIHTDSGLKYNIANLNYDTKLDKFVYKVAVDSVFIFNPKNVKQASLNKKIYKRYYNHSLQKYYELVAYGKGKEVLKRSKKIIKKGREDPFTKKRKQDRYILETEYFLNSKSGIKKLTLKKKSFLKIFDDESLEIKKYISKNKLSIKDDDAIRKIFKYYKSL